METPPQEAATRNGDNRFAAQLQNVMYLGETEQYQLLLTGGREPASLAKVADEAWRNVKASVINPGAAAPRPGDALTLVCAPQDVVVLAE